jgi:hypothetical protein
MTHDAPIHFHGRFPLAQVRRWALGIGAAWVVCCIVGWIFQPAAFYRSYLFAWLFWLGVTMGAMGIVMMHHMLGGEWGRMTRRLGEHAAMTLPLLIVLFIPVLIGIRSLYSWSRPEVVAADALIRHKQPYLNVGFFTARACIYGIIWLSMAWYLRSRSLRQDRSPDWRTTLYLHNVSAGGIVVYFITMSFAGMDWMMSRDPHWYSTIFGFMLICGQGVSGTCLLIVLFALLIDTPPFKTLARPSHFNDLGNILLTFVILWAYMAFVQLLVIWMANKQDEIPWYVQRLSNGWWWIGLGLVLLHFLVPFIVLLMRQAKQATPVMLGLCAGLLVLRAVDVFWIVSPSGDDPRPLLRHVLSWMDFVFPVGMGGLWVAMLLWLMEGHPLAIEAPVFRAAEPRGA